MFKQIADVVAPEISGENALHLVGGITQFHRIQASPHFREAAVWCCDQLKGYGLQSEVLSFPADGKTTYWSTTLFKEWRIESATLEIEGKVWAQFRDKKVSLIQRSHPINVEAEVVFIESNKEEAFKNVKGKIVFSPLPLEKVMDFAIHYGAAGIIVSGIREISLRTRLDVPDAVHYYSFWEEESSGFVLSPRQGDELRKMIEKKPVKAKMRVESSLYPGFLEVVEAFIPGETEEEVVVVAHLCHPQPSANDNASGSAVLLEVARALHTLIADKKLGTPRRGIRFLLVPEMNGTIAYLASNEGKIPLMVAAVNLDMVGENQELCRSSLLVERTPDAMPSCVNDLMEVIFEDRTREVGNLSSTEKYASFRHAITPFSGASDHYIFSDPSVGVPCPMLIQWPDLFYHSSLDTVDKVDPRSLQRVGVLAGVYAYFLANAGEKEAEWLAQIVCEKGKERISKKVREILTGVDHRDCTYLDYILERETRALQSVKRLGRVDTASLEKEIEQYVQTEKKKLPKKEIKIEECTWVPKRVCRGPVSVRKVLSEIPFEERMAYKRKDEEYENARVLKDMAVYWADGKRTVSQISEKIAMETGESSLGFLKWYFTFLEKHKLIVLER